MEGFSLRRPEIPQADHPDFVKYTVALDHEEIVFMKSLVTDRWWIISSDVIPLNNKKSDFAFISCSKEDYDMTCLNELPMRLISSKKRGYN